MRLHLRSSLALASWMALMLSSLPLDFAGGEKDFFQGSNLGDGNNYNPPGAPTNQSDVLLTTDATMLHGLGVMMNSLNQTNNNMYQVDGLTIERISSDSISGGTFDAVYLGGNASILTIGTLFMNSGALNVAQPGGSLNIDRLNRSNFYAPIFKTGAGTLNVTQTLASNSSIFNVRGGTVNLKGGYFSYYGGIDLSNLNTGTGSAVTLNTSSAITCQYFGGSIAAASSGANTVTLNLMNSSKLTIALNGGAGGGTYQGDITGTGSVEITPSNTVVFSGHYTYTGTTIVGNGTFEQDGTGNNQGNYAIIFAGTKLTGNGTIGLATNGTISNSGIIAPGNSSDPLGKLTAVTSGTGGVYFSGPNGSPATLSIRIGAGGSSSQLAIIGGSLTLGQYVTLQLAPTGLMSFDGSSYTIATFASASGTFSSISGLPSDYQIVYSPTDIVLLPVPEPNVWYLCAIGCGIFAINLLRKTIGARRVPRLGL